MAKSRAATTAAAAAEPLVARRRSARNVKKGDDSPLIKQEEPTITPRKALKRESATSTASSRRSKRVKINHTSLPSPSSPSFPDVKQSSSSPPLLVATAKSEPKQGRTRPGKGSSPSNKKSSGTSSDSNKGKEGKDKVAADLVLQARKLKSHAQFARESPFPEFARPTPAECALAHDILVSLHGERVRPEGARTAAPRDAAGCGASPSVLDALVRTILSQNTSDRNSSQAKQGMDAAYGGSDQWEAIATSGQAKLQAAITSGGLAATKSRVILSVLEQVKQKHGTYSLDHLFEASDDDATCELLSFRGVGPKTAACVLLFCLRRDTNLAVDTHVHRITGLLGWRPPGATREEAHAHLNARVPDTLKYPLHVLLVTHGRTCDECRAGGRVLGRCALRRAFRGAVVVGGAADEEARRGEIERVKAEESGVKTDREAIAHAVEQTS
ncbi:hypothetical protein DL766_004824 [Monosporascus sp. MC13-8B]|uniref:HhH-GPD domain-containing protein n=1 Tax=Monosporascus cannonballus TaxID=155416 RepID=A0ABY0HKY6_9PEZI|nr:hypothetical protein DL762_001261 [Monosporascus cannonballus]RYP30552.1 hypothetical protein DL766_004824 [Monosporascus sp. MC13-8B]